MIRSQVLRAIAQNRVPGLHFVGSFLDVSWDRVAPEQTRLSLDVAPHIADADGQLNVGALAMLTDLALANAMRATLEPHQRLATLSMAFELTGAARTGRIEAAGRFHGFVREGKGRIGKGEVSIFENQTAIGIGTGAFMALDPPSNVTLHPVRYRTRDLPPVDPIAEGRLDETEKTILAHADAALADPRPSFIERFLGYLPHRTESGATCVMANGPHVGNRVGHAQGGVLLGLAASTAACALPPSWKLSGVFAWYLRPGEGDKLTAHSSIVHQGRLTALVRTTVSDPEGATVIEVMTTHTHH